MRVVVLLGIVCLVGNVYGTVAFPPLVTVDEEALSSWSDEIEKAAEEAVRSINEMHLQQREKGDQVAMGVDGLQGIFELEDVPLESARAAPGVVYEAFVQMKQIDATQIETSEQSIAIRSAFGSIRSSVEHSRPPEFLQRAAFASLSTSRIPTN